MFGRLPKNAAIEPVEKAITDPNSFEGEIRYANAVNGLIYLVIDNGDSYLYIWKFQCATINWSRY